MTEPTYVAHFWPESKREAARVELVCYLDDFHRGAVTVELSVELVRLAQHRAEAARNEFWGVKNE